jgi:hypothetical protein
VGAVSIKYGELSPMIQSHDGSRNKSESLVKWKNS